MTTSTLPDVQRGDSAPPAFHPVLPHPAARSPQEVLRRLPRPQSLPVRPIEHDGERGIGHTALGQIVVAEDVVAKLAARAVLDLDGVGAAAPRLLGKELSGGPLDTFGVRSSELGALPSCSAQVDGHLAFVDLTISVRYPLSVRQTVAAVRAHVISTVGAMAGVQIVEVDVKVLALLRDLPRSQRVH